MRKIFISIPWFWPAYKAGGPIQSIINLVTQYSNNIQYYIFTGNKDLGGEVLNGIKTDQWVEYNAHTKVWYASHKATTALKNNVKEIVPDKLFIIGLFSPVFNIAPLLGIKKVQKIISPRGMLHPGALQQKPVKKKIFLFLLKNTKAIKTAVFHATDAEEEKWIRKHFGHNARVLPASNFPRLFQPKISHKEKGLLKLVSIALISPMKNHLMVLEALAKCTGNIEYTIYGPVKDEFYWQRCLEQIKKLPPNIKVNYAGTLASADVEDALKKADVFIMPSQSENFAHAICEALSAGLPVITSNHTPWNQLKEFSAGINCNLDDRELAEAINFFADMDTEKFKGWSVAAITYINEKIKTEIIQEQYQQLFGI